MHPEDIKAEIRKKGSSLVDIAREMNVGPMTVSHVVHSRGVSRRVAQRISEVTGIPISRLWPGGYKAKQTKTAHVVDSSPGALKAGR
mgnify:CR=1 FL=1